MKAFPSFSEIWRFSAVIITFRRRVPSWARLIRSANERLIQNQILTALWVVFNLFFHVMIDCGPDPFNCILSGITIGYWIACSLVDWIHLAHGQDLTSNLPPLTNSRLNFSTHWSLSYTNTSMSARMRANSPFNRYTYLKFAHVGERMLLLLSCVRSIAESSSIPSNRALHSAIAAIYDLLGIFKGNELNLCTISRFLLVPLQK